MGNDGGSTVIYQIDNTEVERLLTEQNELLKEQWEFLQEQREELNTHMQSLEGYTIATVALLGLLVGAVLGIAVAKLFYRLWRG